MNTDLASCDPPSEGAEQVGTSPPDGTLPEGHPVQLRVGSVDDEGEPCLGWDTVWLEELQDASMVLNEGRSRLESWMVENGVDEGELLDCPVTQAIDPAIVRDLVTHRLPVPNPATSPDWALTGMATYLEIGAGVEFDETLTGELLPVAVSVSGHAVYHVDWGDGTVSEHRSEGGPYPHGDVVHAYATAVEEGVEIVVTPVWDLEWSAAGVTMPLEIELAPASYPLPVRELQSVRSVD